MLVWCHQCLYIARWELPDIHMYPVNISLDLQPGMLHFFRIVPLKISPFYSALTFCQSTHAYANSPDQCEAESFGKQLVRETRYLCYTTADNYSSLKLRSKVPIKSTEIGRLLIFYMAAATKQTTDSFLLLRILFLISHWQLGKRDLRTYSMLQTSDARGKKC